MKEQMTCTQLLRDDRVVISSMKLPGQNTVAMARVLSRPASTISRKLRRNSCPSLGHTSNSARVLHARRRSACKPAAKLDVKSVAWGVALTLLDWKRLPQQIAATLKRVFPNEPERHVSHETIYTANYVQPRGELRRQPVACLRQGRNTRLPRTRGTDRRGQIPDMVSIHVRPSEVIDRVMPSHWEGDFINGAGNKSSVGVLVERTSRLVRLAKMADATAASALAGLSAKLNSIAEPMRQSLTYDQGKELTRHKELTARTGVAVYFCDSHSPWRRGTCENTNGLLRQYLPKGTDLSVYSQDELDTIADSMNNRPRATHNWLTPLEVSAQTLAGSHQPVTPVQ
jgi:IS30 family transposase